MTGVVSGFVPAVIGILLGVVSDLPQPAQDLIRSAPKVATIRGALLYGGGGILGAKGGKRVLGRFLGGSASKASRTNVSTSGGTPESIKDDETAFTLPGFLPVSKGIRKVSHNEIHAIELGIVVGFVVIWLFSIGRTNAAGVIVVAFIAGALGFRRYKTKAVATVRMEPWYGFIAFAIGAAAGWLFFQGPVPPSIQVPGSIPV